MAEPRRGLCMPLIVPNGWKRLCCAAGWVVAAGLVGCGAHKNHEERRAKADEQRARDEELGVDTEPEPTPATCDLQEDGIEFLAPPIWDFTSATPYSYDDGSTGTGGALLEESGTGKLLPMQRCADRDVDSIYRIWGGPYMAWGGGIGTSVLDFNASARSISGCSNGAGTPNCSSSEEWLQARTLDASAWDGISFWARRGSQSQAGIRVALGDQYTDDDLNIDPHPPEALFGAEERADLRLGSDDGIDVEQKECKRTRQCSCDGNRPCTLDPESGMHLCYDPSYEAPPRREAGAYDEEYLCGQDACDYLYATQRFYDPAFHGRACTPYVFASGRSASYCFDPETDPAPAEGYETCGDHWTKGVALSGDWQFFKVPFSDLRQQGYGKDSPRLLTDQISIVRFTWAAGFIDYFLDDVRFYRVRR